MLNRQVITAVLYDSVGGYNEYFIFSHSEE